ncbi:PEP-CTERM sorting domain-containing protein [Kiritimatiellaeota bacterium B1221]|nr:PEP-CTERM sorting domain-containing protein [Kiritimatiellaeota bacterium B1221]
MSKLKFLLMVLLAGIAQLHAQSIFNGYAYLSSGTTAGSGATWFDLNGSAQLQDFDGADLDTYFTIEDNLWLGGQTGFWSNSEGVAYVTMHYSITGDATATGSKSYAFQSYSAPDDQWGTDVNGANGSDLSIDLISAHSLSAGDYTLAIWVEGKPNSSVAIFDNNSGSNHIATFTVIPETSSIFMLGLTGLAAGLVLRKRKRA